MSCGSSGACQRGRNLHPLERDMSCWKTTKNMKKNNPLPTIPCGSMLMYPTSVPLIGPLPSHPFSLICTFPGVFSFPRLLIGPIVLQCPIPLPYWLSPLAPSLPHPQALSPLVLMLCSTPHSPYLNLDPQLFPVFAPGPLSCAWNKEQTCPVGPHAKSLFTSQWF